jgi:hypothetical protein
MPDVHPTRRRGVSHPLGGEGETTGLVDGDASHEATTVTGTDNPVAGVSPGMRCRLLAAGLGVGVLAVALSACSTGDASRPPAEEGVSTNTTEFVATGENLAPDPTSTRTLTGAQGSLVPLRFSDIPRISDLAVIVDVVDIKPSRLNTPDGRFPAIDPDRGPEQTRGLFPETPVVVRVVEVLAERPAVPSGWKVGEEREIVIHGGYFRTILGPEEAAALGILVTKGPEGPGLVAEEGPPTGPVDYNIGLSPSVSLAEGQRLLMFLRRDVDRLGRDRWVPADPRAFFTLGPGGDLARAIPNLPGAFDDPGSVTHLIAALRVAEGFATTSGNIDTLRAKGLEP